MQHCETMQRLFEDKRTTSVLMGCWMVLSCIVFNGLGAFHVQFMTFGPSVDTKFMTIAIDTWHKWSCLAIFTFMNTSINEFVGNSLCPW